jgi:hypothetical protein
MTGRVYPVSGRLAVSGFFAVGGEARLIRYDHWESVAPARHDGD